HPRCGPPPEYRQRLELLQRVFLRLQGGPPVDVFLILVLRYAVESSRTLNVLELPLGVPLTARSRHARALSQWPFDAMHPSRPELQFAVTQHRPKIHQLELPS